jgi:haloalkane dehalogenase
VVETSHWEALVARGAHQLPVRESMMQMVDTRPVGHQGDPQAPVLVFLHGNPTSSFLWRHVITALMDRFRCVAIDLIGMGGSGKPDLDYTWAVHRDYVAEALAGLDTEARAIRLVMHDWGVALGLDYARGHPERVAGVAMMEGHLRALGSWQDFDEAGRALFRELRDPVRGRRKIEEENFFIPTVLPSGMHHQLTEDEQRAYSAPFPTPRSRRPIWAWVTQIPINGDPPDVRNAVEENLTWLESTQTPRLLLHADPGAIIDSAYAAEIAARCPGLTTRTVGPGLHFLPEDQSNTIAEHLATWIQS